MTLQTRRRLWVCLIVLALAFPIETILLQALSTQDSGQAVAQWVSGLTSEDLDAALDQVESYPVLYRRELMRAVSPDRRANIWRKHAERYVKQHPELDESARKLIDAAVALMTAETFSSPTPETRDSIRVIGEQLIAIAGKDATYTLLYRLGPADGTFASLEPIQMRLANLVRGAMVALAEGEDCDCSTDFGCDGYYVCSSSSGCSPDEEWPMCGWLWNETCNGLCKARENN